MISVTRKIILGSASPRRFQLLQAIFPEVEVRAKNVDETFPDHLRGKEIPEFLAEQKSKAFDGELQQDEIVVTADTIVWFDNHVLNKPAGGGEALVMLRKLSGNSHQVFTGVCIASGNRKNIFSVESQVEFITADDKTLADYIQQYRPFDKAGSYGAQECLPDGMNPLSKKEVLFLDAIGRPKLFEESLAVKDHAKVPLIKKIQGSYFNVMGLPVAELYELLQEQFLVQ
jgi:septum formation protein